MLFESIGMLLLAFVSLAAVLFGPMIVALTQYTPRLSQMTARRVVARRAVVIFRNVVWKAELTSRA